MHDVDQLIQLIRGRQFDEAIEMLNASPQLATACSAAEGQLHGATPLHWAAHRNAVDVSKRLIELGADVNQSASDWWLTPLAWGADAASYEVVELLLDHGAQVDQDAVVGTTALHAAAMGGSTCGNGDPEGYIRTAELLIARGANVNNQSQGDRPSTPLDHAIQYNNQHVADVLRRHGGRRSEPSDGAASGTTE